MAVNLVRRRSKRSSGAPATPPLAIGEIGQTVFACPSCARPLAMGARRCPGCGSRLLMGVLARRAVVFIAEGVLAGVLFGGLLMAGLFLVNQPGRDAETAAAAVAAAGLPAQTVAPTSAPSASSEPAPSVEPGEGTIPAVSALTRSAMSQVLAVDSRLAASSTALKTALKASKFDTLAAAALLRAASADATIGLQLTPYIALWPNGKALAAELATFYTAVHNASAKGLAASIHNGKAYKKASSSLVSILGRLPTLDAKTSGVAAGAGIDLAPQSGSRAP